jgi:hypothetical protein
MDASALISTALDELLTPAAKLSDILLKVKAIGYFIGNQELKQWADVELTGYSGSSLPTPSYRKIGVVPEANLIHEYYSQTGGWQPNKKIPLEFLDNDVKEALEYVTIKQGVAEVERLADNDINPRINIATVMQNYITNKLYRKNGWLIHSAWQLIPVNHLSALLAKIRAKLVDLLLELDQLSKDVSLQSLQGRQAANDSVSKALHSISAGANSVINISHGDKSVQATNTGNQAQLNIASGETISQNIGASSAASLDELLKQLAHLIITDEAFTANRQEMEHQLETVKVQLQKPEPKKGIIKRAFESLTELAADGAGVMAGHAIFEVLHKAPELLAAAGIG